MRSNVGGSEKLTPDGSPQWCVRYSPRSAGSFNVTFVITNSSGTFTLKSDTFEASHVNYYCVTKIIILSKFVFQEDLAGFIKLGTNQIHFQFTNKR